MEPGSINDEELLLHRPASRHLGPRLVDRDGPFGQSCECNNLPRQTLSIDTVNYILPWLAAALGLMGLSMPLVLQMGGCTSGGPTQAWLGRCGGQTGSTQR